jgi:hypothetical protein
MAENLTIPIILLVIGVIGWCVWLTIEIFGAKKDIAVNTANDTSVTSKVNDVKNDIEKKVDKLEDHMNRKFDQVFEEIRKITQR